MSMNEILAEIPRLSESEREVLLSRLVEMDSGAGLEETPEMLAAIDAGKRSLEAGAGVTLDEARRRLSEWITK
jgi:hypothetical protein